MQLRAVTLMAAESHRKNREKKKKKKKIQAVFNSIKIQAESELHSWVVVVVASSFFHA